MKKAFLTIKAEPELREMVEKMAKRERRSLADQAAYLMEMGIKATERPIGPSDPTYALQGIGPVMGVVNG